MRNSIKWILVAIVILASAWGIGAGREARQLADRERAADLDGALLRATYSPLHFKPAIDAATDQQCLACHKEILEDKPRVASPAGARAADSLAWYQRTSTYSGEQDSFHRRHLVTPLAKALMNLRCNTCHQGHDPRDEVPGSSATSAAQSDTAFTLRKQVNPETTCLKCHGQMPAREIMGLPGPWPEVRQQFKNDCLSCHVVFRTNRHQVNYLKAEAIEEAAKAGAATSTGGDVCYGCHGGRPWYRIAYPYARNPWPGMPEVTPEWARLRPRHSELRYLTQSDNSKPAEH
jgi:nitrate/TMAO reductase-like tetraheme cytochrome c subunit